MTFSMSCFFSHFCFGFSAKKEDPFGFEFDISGLFSNEFVLWVWKKALRNVKNPVLSLGPRRGWKQRTQWLERSWQWSSQWRRCGILVVATVFGRMRVGLPGHIPAANCRFFHGFLEDSNEFSFYCWHPGTPKGWGGFKMFNYWGCYAF